MPSASWARVERDVPPSLCLVLSNTVSLYLSKECNAPAVGGKCDLRGCHMWISSLEACESLGPSAWLNPPPWLGNQLGKRRNIFSHNKCVPWSQLLHLSVSIYKNIHRFWGMDVRLPAKVNVQSAIVHGVIRDSKLLLWKTEILRNTLGMCPSLLA